MSRSRLRQPRWTPIATQLGRKQNRLTKRGPTQGLQRPPTLLSVAGHGPRQLLRPLYTYGHAPGRWTDAMGGMPPRAPGEARSVAEQLIRAKRPRRRPPRVTGADHSAWCSGASSARARILSDRRTAKLRRHIFHTAGNSPPSVKRRAWTPVKRHVLRRPPQGTGNDLNDELTGYRRATEHRAWRTTPDVPTVGSRAKVAAASAINTTSVVRIYLQFFS